MSRRVAAIVTINRGVMAAVLVAVVIGTWASPGDAGGEDHRWFDWVGKAGGDRFGADVCFVGDTDGDGVCDVAVGAPRSTVGGASTLGSVVVYSGATGVERFTIAASDASWLGASIAPAGDVDGDGSADIAVGAPFAATTGEVQVYSGCDGLLVARFSGVKSGDRFGHAIDVAGDIDGDGTIDLVVGSPFADPTVKDAGRAVVIDLIGTAGEIFEVSGGAFLDQLGFAVSGVGDLDLDGIPELMVGVPFADAGAFNGGEARVYRATDASVMHSFLGTAPADQLGFSVASAGEVDADGTGDLLIGVPAADGVGIDAGRVDVRSGVTGALLFSVAGSHPEDTLGFVGRAGDIDGDGHADLVVGAPSSDAAGTESGEVRLISGATGVAIEIFHGLDPFDWMGTALDGGVDVNGDAIPDLLIGSPGHDDHPEKPGRARLLSGVPLALTSETHQLSLAAAGGTDLFMHAPSRFANCPYWLVGTSTGTTPGFVVGGWTVPLNPQGGYFLYSVQSPNSPLLAASMGTLDASGRAIAHFDLPNGLPSAAAGITLHHAFVVFTSTTGSVIFASDAVPLSLVP